MWALPLFYLAFRRVRKHAAVPGLIKTVFLVENIRTCYTLSLWANDEAIAAFSDKVIHIATANWSFRHVYRHDMRRAEIWSTEWRIYGVSFNLNWEGVELTGALRDATVGGTASHV